MMDMLARVGVVIIGRNEGDRLLRCINSLVGHVTQLVYVDSGSMDDSVGAARSLGAEVVELDMTLPFTAARARNEGFERMRELYPHAEYVQFVDGDCEVSSSWIKSALDFLDAHQDVAAVAGRRRERFPERTVYNMLCDMEWNTPIGKTKACGGDALMRVEAFQEVNGFRPDLIAGEEPELCVRLRAAGWEIWRLDHEMTLHDAAMIRFSQWCKRSIRAGHAYAEGAYLHGTPPERHWVSESKRAWLWGLGFLLMALLLCLISFKLGVALLLVYPLQIVRLALKNIPGGKKAWIMAFFLVLGKFPEMVGQLKFLWRLHTGKQGRLIEYK